MSRLPSFVFLSLAWGCSLVAAPPAHAHKLKVLTSFLPVYCFTANVAGNLAEVENLLPANVEPHDYQFSRKDLHRLADADLILINGLGLERWLEKAFQNAAPSRRKSVVEVFTGLEGQLIAASLSHLSDRSDRSDPSHPSSLVARQAPGPQSQPHRPAGTPPNPHVWLDPRLARHAVTNILRALQAADPTHASSYAANAAEYLARLDKLDAALEQALGAVRGAAIVTYHDAFPYFARRYGLNIVGVVEPVAEVEPSLKSLAALYRSVRANQATALFAEPPAASRLARQIGRDLQLPLAQLDTIEAGPMNPTAYEEGMKNNQLVLLKYLKPDAQRPSP